MLATSIRRASIQVVARSFGTKVQVDANSFKDEYAKLHNLKALQEKYKPKENPELEKLKVEYKKILTAKVEDITEKNFPTAVKLVGAFPTDAEIRAQVNTAFPILTTDVDALIKEYNVPLTQQYEAATKDLHAKYDKFQQVIEDLDDAYSKLSTLTDFQATNVCEHKLFEALQGKDLNVVLEDMTKEIKHEMAISGIKLQ